MVLRRRETGGDQQRAKFVAVKTGGVRLVVEPPPDVDGRGVIDDPFFLGVTEETCDRAESSGQCRPGLALRFEITAKHAMSIRRTENKGRSCSAHQLTNCRRSNAYASRVKPR